MTLTASGVRTLLFCGGSWGTGTLLTWLSPVPAEPVGFGGELHHRSGSWPAWELHALHCPRHHLLPELPASMAFPGCSPCPVLPTLFKCAVPRQEHPSICHVGGCLAALVPSLYRVTSASIWVTVCAWGGGSCGCTTGSHLFPLLLLLAAARL